MKNWFELKYSLRVLRKSPGHTSMCIGIVALSLCVGMIALTLVYNLLLKPLNFDNSDRWAHLTRVSAPGDVSQGGDTIDSFHYQYLKDNNTVFDKLGAIRAFSESRMNFGDSATRVSSAEVTPHIFEASGVQAYLGRSLLSSDSVSDNEVAVISYSLWQNYFSANPDIVGETVNFDESPLTIVGVMPKDTAFGMKHDVWIANQSWLANRPDADNIRTITPVGILKAGISFKLAQQQLSELTEQLKADHPDFYSGETSVLVSPFKYFLNEDSTAVYIAVAVFSCIIVLLGAVNIANLLMSRSIERRQEFAVRTCVGSSSLDVYRQSLAESFLVCAIATAIAIPITFLGMTAINFYLNNIGNAQGWAAPSDWYLQLDAASLTIAFIVVSVIWLICGLSPALKLRKIRASEVLSDNKGTSDQHSFRSTKILVGTQIVAAFFLLIVSGSLLVAIIGIVDADYGLETKNRYVIDLELPRQYEAPEERVEAIKTIETLLSTNSAIANVSGLTGLPHTGFRFPYAIADRDISVNEQFPNLKISMYSPHSFKMLGVDIVQGRGFDSTDADSANAVTIVDSNFAKAMWPNESPLNKKIQIPAQSGNWLRVIGVSEPIVAGIRFANFNRENSVYVPIDRIFSNQLHIVIETFDEERTVDVFTWVREAVSNTDSRIAVYDPRTLSEHLLGPTYGLQMIGNIFIGFGIIAVVLAIVGVFAVISRSVLQQTRSIGIRRAIGSSNKKVLLIYLKQGGIYLLSGLILGGGAAVLVNNGLSSLFSELPQATPLVAFIVVIVLGFMIAIASIAPTLKALKYEPGDALHHS